MDPATTTLTAPDARLVVEVVAETDGVAAVRVAGTLDLTTAQQLDVVAEHLGRDPQRDIVIDCAALRFCDSSGLRALLGVRRRQSDTATCTLLRPRPILVRLLEVTGLRDLFVLDRPGRTTPT